MSLSLETAGRFILGAQNNIVRGEIYLDVSRSNVNLVSGSPKQFVVNTPNLDAYIFECTTTARAGEWIRAIDSAMLPATELPRDYMYRGTKAARILKKRSSVERIKSANLSDVDSNILEITAPPESEPGQQITVEHAGKKLRITIPAGVFPGDVFGVKLGSNKMAGTEKGETIEHAGYVLKYAATTAAQPKKKVRLSR